MNDLRHKLPVNLSALLLLAEMRSKNLLYLAWSKCELAKVRGVCLQFYNIRNPALNQGRGVLVEPRGDAVKYTFQAKSDYPREAAVLLLRGCSGMSKQLAEPFVQMLIDGRPVLICEKQTSQVLFYPVPKESFLGTRGDTDTYTRYPLIIPSPVRVAATQGPKE